MTETKQYTDIDYQVNYKWNSKELAFMDFTVQDMAVIKTSINNGPWKEETEVSPEIILEGTLKFDGCINWTTGGKLAFHFCSIKDAEYLKQLFQKIYEMGIEIGFNKQYMIEK